MSELQSILTDSSMLSAEYSAAVQDRAIKEMRKAKSEYDASIRRCTHIPEQVWAAQQFYLTLSITLALTLKSLGAEEIFDEFREVFYKVNSTKRR